MMFVTRPIDPNEPDGCRQKVQSKNLLHYPTLQQVALWACEV